MDLRPKGRSASEIPGRNADEMEPGTFKDRLLMERDPHQLIEGMVIAGYAIETDVAYIFLRGEYMLAARAVEKRDR